MSSVLYNKRFFKLLLVLNIARFICRGVCCCADGACSTINERDCPIGRYIEHENLFLEVKADDKKRGFFIRVFEYLAINTKEIFITVLVSIVIATFFLTDIPLFLRIMGIGSSIFPVNTDPIKEHVGVIFFLVAIIAALAASIYLFWSFYVGYRKEEIAKSDTMFVRALNSVYAKLVTSRDVSAGFSELMLNCSHVISSYFESVLKQNSIGCAIRIKKDDEGGQSITLVQELGSLQNGEIQQSL